MSAADLPFHQRPLPADDAMAALKLAATSFLSHSQNTLPSPPPPAGRPHPITTSSPKPVLPTLHTKMASTRGPAKPLTPLQQPGNFSHMPSPKLPYTPNTPNTPVFRNQHHHHYHNQQNHISSLPSPPLSSVEPPHSAGFFLKSPLQERCEALETELAALKLRLKRSEHSSSVKEKRLSSIHQQQDTTLAQLQETQQDLSETKSALTLNQELVRQMETMTQEQECRLKEILSERADEMKKSYTENTKQQKRLEQSAEKAEKLQQENRQLMEQLCELRTLVAEVSAQLDVESINPEKTQSCRQTASELENQTSKYKTEVERLQALVLMMGNRHVQVQAQLIFFQQQAQQQQMDLAHTAPLPQSPGIASKHGSMTMENSTLSSLLTSVASVASASPSRRTKPTRRFTVNAPRRDGELTMEQRKCEFLMDQISVLQRGYDALRQEKVTLELQLDLQQRQHQYHQQRQKQRKSQSRTLKMEQSSALSKTLAIMIVSPTSTTANALSTIPSTPLLPTISVAEQEREKARIQYELEQAQIRAQKEAKKKEAQRLVAQAAAEEAEREAIRLERIKSLHLKETLASLVAKRSDSRNVHFASSDELKHLEHFCLVNEQQQKQGSLYDSFHNAAAARASRRIASPFSSSSSLRSQLSSTSTSPSPLSTVTSPSLFSSTYSSQTKQPVHYTHSTKHQRSAGQLCGTFTYDIEQCSCCLGTMIDI